MVLVPHSNEIWMCIRRDLFVRGCIFMIPDTDLPIHYSLLRGYNDKFTLEHPHC